MALQLCFSDDEMHDMVRHLCPGEHFPQPGAQDNDKTDEGEERSKRGLQGRSKADHRFTGEKSPC